MPLQKKKKDTENSGSVKSTTVKNNGKTDTNLVNGKSFRLENTVGSIPRNNGRTIAVQNNLNVQDVKPVKVVKTAKNNVVEQPKSYDSMSMDELNNAYNTAKSNTQKAKDAYKKETYNLPLVGLFSETAKAKKKELDKAESEEQKISNELFTRRKDEALGKLSEGTLKAFGEYYDSVSKDSDLKFTPQVAKEHVRKEFMRQGLPYEDVNSDDFFAQMYEYYKFDADKKRAEQKQDETQKKYDNSSTLGKIGMNAKTVAQAPARGASAALEMLYAGTSGYHDPNAPLNIYDDSFDLMNYSDTVRGKTSSDIAEKTNNNKVANAAYNIGMSIGDSAMNTFSLGAFGAPAVTAVSGINAAAQTAKEGTERGLSKNKALSTGLSSGVIEAATEYLPAESVIDMVKTTGNTGVKNAIINILKQSGVEATEETVAEIANTVADNVINGADSQYGRNKANYIMNGASEEEATKAANKDFWSGVGMSALGGAVSGGVMGAGATLLNRAMIPRLEKSTASTDTVNTVENQQNKTPMQEHYDNVEQLRNDNKKRVTAAHDVPDISIPPAHTSETFQHSPLNNTIPTLQKNVNESSVTTVKPMSNIEIEQTKADLFKVTGDIKRDLRNTTNMYYKGENKKEVVSAVEKMIDDYAENPTDENFEMLTKAVNLLNNSMYGQKYTRKRNGVTSVYDNELSVLFNNNVDALCDKATKLSQRTVAESVASNPTFTAEVPKNTGDMQTGPVTAENGQKISKVRTNTMQNSGIATDAELEKNFKDSNYAYNTISEEESLKMAKSMVDSLGDNAADAIINNGVNQSYEVDAAMLSWSKLMGQAREMEAQGLDNTAILKKADRLMRQVQKTGTESGQNIQAFAKWTRTPEGVMKATQDVVANKNKAKLGKNGSKKYDAVMDAADKVSDVFSNGMTYDEAVKYLMDYRSSNPDVDGMNTMLRIVNECKKNNMKLSEDSFKAVVESNPDILPREMKKMLKEGRTTADAGDFIRAMNNVEGLSTGAQKRIADIIQGVQNFELNSPELQKAVDQINIEISKEFPMSKWDKFVEAMHISMLCNMRTDIRNTLANVAMLPEQSMSNKLAAVMEKCYARFNSDFTPTQSVIVSKESKNIAKECYAKQKRSGVAGKYGESLSNDPLENIGNKVAFTLKGDKNIPSRIPLLEKAGTVFKNGLNTVSNKVAGESLFNNLSSNKSMAENIREFTYDLLELGDTPFVKVNYVQRLASAIEAENKARIKTGIEPIKSIEDVPESFINLAFDTAMQATFKDDNWMTNLASSIHKIPVVGDTILPFSKTPANIIMRAGDYSIIGAIKGLANCIRKNGNTREGIEQLSKGLTGIGTATLGVALAASHALVGSLSDDKDEAAFQKQQGIQPFSISTKGIADVYNKITGQEIDLGDTYITIDWAQPAASNLMVGAELYKVFESGENPFDSENIANTILSCAKTWGNTILDNSMFSNIMKLADTSYGNTPMDNLVDSISELPLRLIPQQLNAVSKTSDLKQRSTYDASSKFNTLKNQAMSKVPGLKDMLPQAYDTWGQEKVIANSTGQAAFNNFLNPSGASVATTTDIDSTIQDLFEKTGDNKVFPQKMSTSVTINGNKRVLNTQEYADYQKNVGQTSYKFAKAYLSSDSYKNFGDDVKAGNLNILYGLSKAIYEQEAFGKDMSDSNKKYYEHYKNGGLDELMEYVDYKNTLAKYELSDSDKMIEIWDQSGADGIQKYAEHKEAFKGVGVEYSSNSKGNVVYEERGASGLDMWNKIRSASLKTNESGSKSVDSQLLYNAVSNTNLSDEDKGYYIMNIAPKSDKLDKLYEDFGYENVYRYYKHKYSADYDENGSLKKDEITYYLNQQNMTNEERNYWFDILSGGNTKNPY